MQVVDALGRHRSTVCGLRQDERALHSGLRVERQALSGPLRMHAALSHGFFYVWYKDVRVRGDAAVAGLAQGRMRFVDLLHHRSRQAGEVRQITLQQCFAESYVGQQTVERLYIVAICRGSEKSFGALSPVVGGFQRQRFLTLEVMEETALGEPGSFADVLDSCGGITFGADDVQGRIEELDF